MLEKEPRIIIYLSALMILGQSIIVSQCGQYYFNGIHSLHRQVPFALVIAGVITMINALIWIFIKHGKVPHRFFGSYVAFMLYVPCLSIFCNYTLSPSQPEYSRLVTSGLLAILFVMTAACLDLFHKRPIRLGTQAAGTILGCLSWITMSMVVHTFRDNPIVVGMGYYNVMILMLGCFMGLALLFVTQENIETHSSK